MRCRSIWKRFEHHSPSTACARVSFDIRKARAHSRFRADSAKRQPDTASLGRDRTHAVPVRSVGPCGYPAAYTQDPAARRSDSRYDDPRRGSRVVREVAHLRLPAPRDARTGPREGDAAGAAVDAAMGLDPGLALARAV